MSAETTRHNPSREEVREEATGKLFSTLTAEITEMAPRGIWDWPQLGPMVNEPDRTLQRIANRYIDGEAKRSEVVAAAERLRMRWRAAVERYGGA